MIAISATSGKKHRFLRSGTIFLLLFLASSVLELFGLTNSLKQFTQLIIQPISTAQVAVVAQISKPYLLLVHTWNKGLYTQELERAHARALVQLTELELVQQENAELRKLLETTEKRPESRVVTAPITSFAFPAVAVGAEQTIAVGDLVAYEGSLLGSITAVEQFYASVSLLSARSEKRLLVVTESEVQGLLVGDGRNVLLTQVRNQDRLVVGERVFTMGQEGVPRGMLIGTIRSIKVNPAAATQQAIIQQYSSFYDLAIVEIL